MNGYKQFIVDNLVIASVEVPKKKDRDLLYVIFKLCHEGPNDNHDYFTASVLKNAYKSCVNKPLNWEHGNVCFGFIDKSELLQEDNGVYYIKCGGYVWKYNFPVVANEIINGFADGTLKVSMECYYKDAEYWIGEDDNKVILSEDEVRELGIQLTENGDIITKYYEGQPVYRVFKEVLFGGAALTRNPADKQAILLAVASDFNPVKIYHDALHKAYELGIFNKLSIDEIIVEHKRLHDKFNNLI